MNQKSKEKYIKSKGWETFRSSKYWINAILMDDLTLDLGGVSLDQAYIL